MLPAPLQRSLAALEIVAFATLLRSVAFDRWITVLMSVILLASALGARRGRTWGVALSFAASFFFPLAFVLGMAPSWFVLVGLFAAAPFALTWRSFLQADQAAAKWLAGLSMGAGALVALVWQQIAWPVFLTFPALFPSGRPQNGWFVMALVVGALGVGLSRRRRDRSSGLRVEARAERMRVAAAPEATSREMKLPEGEDGEEEFSESSNRSVRAARSRA